MRTEDQRDAMSASQPATTATSAGRRPLEQWKANTVRFTAFPTKVFEVSARSRWRELLNEDPQQSSWDRVQQQFAESGLVGDAQLVMTMALGRFDLLYAPPDGATLLPETGEIPTIGEAGPCLTRLCGIAKSAIRSLPELSRIAVGAIVILPVSSRENGYAQLGAYLPAVVLDPVGSTDFGYQINRRRDSTTIRELPINRVGKWSVMSTRALSFLERGAVIGERRGYACRLELDINTAPENTTAIAPQALPDLIEECRGLLLEIVEKGDVP